tara:strand:+ start:2168 stop:3220 length:1053 start_codon:yes stop_codon:yes gene_type:complete
VRVEWSKPDFGPAELSAAERSLRSYIGANGPEVTRFEENFAAAVGAKHAIAVCNGTAALVVALMCMREEHGDMHVGVPSFTFIASANAAHHVFERVTLLDSDPHTWNVSPENVPDNIDLLMTVDVGGLSCDYGALSNLGVPLIGDSAESLGATCDGSLVGTQAEMHCFSLHRAKIVSCGEGGAITTNSDHLAAKARSIINHGYAASKKSYEYVHDTHGLNFRMSDVNASIGNEQLKKLSSYVRHRNQIAQIYRDELGSLVEMQEYDNDRFTNNYFFFGILTENRDRLLHHMLENDVMVKTWTAVHQQPVWDSTDLPAAQEISDKIILLPIHNTITTSEVEYVIATLKEGL